jgi:hypothetical protein
MTKINASVRSSIRKKTLDEILEDDYAKTAFDKLVKNGAQQEHLKTLLRSIADLPEKTRSDRRKAKCRRVERRNVLALANKARRLATQIEDVGNAGPMVIRLVSPELHEQLVNTPKLLRRFAEAWVEAHEGPRGQAISERNWAIISLLEFIRRTTKKPHYREVADLLDAIDSPDNSRKTHRIWHERRMERLMTRFMNFARPDLRKRRK